jgi:type VI protein secretion system component Hcp
MPIYMKFGDGPDVKGDVSDEGYKGWISLRDATHGASRPMNPNYGSGVDRGVGDASCSEYHIVKDVDLGSVDLKKAFYNAKKDAKAAKTVTITTVLSNGSTYSDILENCLISSYSLRFSKDEGSGAVQMLETMSLNYTAIKHEATPLLADNTTADPVRVRYDLTTPQSGAS